MLNLTVYLSDLVHEFDLFSLGKLASELLQKVLFLIQNIDFAQILVILCLSHLILNGSYMFLTHGAGKGAS